MELTLTFKTLKNITKFLGEPKLIASNFLVDELDPEANRPWPQKGDFCQIYLFPWC